MSDSKQRFQRNDRVLKSREYERLRQNAHQRTNREFVMLVQRKSATPVEVRNRLGISASRRIGNAVARNRVKRAVREWFRHSRSEIDFPGPIVVIARRDAAGKTTPDIRASLTELSQMMSKHLQAQR